MVRKRSCPAVSHYDPLALIPAKRHTLALTICNFTVFPSNSIVRIFCLVVSFSLLNTCSKTYEINTDGRDVALRVCVIRKSQQQAGLSNTGVPDKEELEEVIVSAKIVSNVIVGFWERMVAAGAHVLLIEGHAGKGKVNSRAQNRQ